MSKGDDVYVVKVEHPPTPDLDDLQQQEPTYTEPNPCVPVRVEGPVRTQKLPNMAGPVTADSCPQFAAGATPTRILSANLARARAVLVSDTKWFYVTGSPSGVRGPIPANTPIVVEHCDNAWAFGNGADAVVTCIQEYYGHN